MNADERGGLLTGGRKSLGRTHGARNPSRVYLPRPQHPYLCLSAFIPAKFFMDKTITVQICGKWRCSTKMGDIGRGVRPLAGCMWPRPVVAGKYATKIFVDFTKLFMYVCV